MSTIYSVIPIIWSGFAKWHTADKWFKGIGLEEVDFNFDRSERLDTSAEQSTELEGSTQVLAM